MTLRVVELFSGIGAQRMALTLAGIPHKVVGVSEIDEPAIRSYAAIYGDCPNLGDITKVGTLPPCDLVTYSFPCQDLSIQGKKKGMEEGTRSGLVWEVMRILKAMVWRKKIYDGIQVVADLDVPTNFDTMRRIFSPMGLCRTLTKGDKSKQPKIIMGKTKEGFQIRTLSPRECWRLMGFPDWAYERAAAVSSDKNLYDQAGNSIVVDVLVSIFVSMFRTKGNHIQKRITEVMA